MGRRILNRKELRADYDEAERRKQTPDEDPEAEGETEEEDVSHDVRQDLGAFVGCPVGDCRRNACTDCRRLRGTACACADALRNDRIWNLTPE